MKLRSSLLVGLVALGGLLVPAASGAKPLRSCNGSRSLCSRPFNQVVLPATHNSMSAASLGWNIPNQQVPIGAQLRDGIRGLLIDTHYGELRPDGVVATDDDRTRSVGPRSTYLCHVYCELGASPLDEQLRVIRDFLRANPHNVLVLDVEDYVTPEGFARAMKLSGLLKYAYTRTPGPRWPTLQWMIRHNQQVVVLAEHDGGDGAYPWLHVDYDGIVQETPYSFQNQTDLTEPANWPSSCATNRGGPNGSLFLMNHWSPPTPPDHADPSQYAALNAKSVLVGRARECASLRGLLPTIVAVDQYRYGDLFGAVKRLNQLQGQALRAR